MAMRLFLLYVITELAVIVALAATIGFGWTVLLLLSTFVLGLALAGSQLKRKSCGVTPVTCMGLSHTQKEPSYDDHREGACGLR
jgi:UPF0716 protein FxsA